jgi:IclR family KDG regulon transcriptional repressor
MSSNHPQNSVPAVHRAIDVLEFVSSTQREVSFAEIMENLDIPRQSLFRILNTLCDRGFLDKSGQRGLYRIGVKFLYLGQGLPEKFELRKAAWDEMKTLSRKTKKTIELSSLDRDQLILLEQIPGTEDMTHYARAGSVIPYLHTVSVGKIYLAEMDAEKRRRVLGKIGLPTMTKYTITDMERLEDEIRVTQERGYGFEDQELREGVRRVAAPVFNSKGKLEGCIGLSAPIFSFSLDDVDRYGQMVRKAADKASQELGYKFK